MRDGRRFLFFDGRTDDWIRKDGENFSAAQVGAPPAGAPGRASRGGLRRAVPGLGRVGDGGADAARGRAASIPHAFFELLRAAGRTHGGMDRKWFPDFVRIVDDFEFTQTQKILVRNLKHAALRPEPPRRRADLLAPPRRRRASARSQPRTTRRCAREFARSERLELLDR